MIEFKEIPASKSSITKRKPIFGVGINDANYISHLKINNKKVRCPFYVKWTDMLKRCYSEKYQKKQPTYKECTICKEWLLFSNFKLWMKKQDWKDKELDKDMLFQGNKHYSPKFCIFIPQEINKLFLSRTSKRGLYRQGLYFNKQVRKFQVQCNVNGVVTYLGRYETQDLAFEAYKKFKYKLIKEVALLQSEPLRSAMLSYVIR